MTIPKFVSNRPRTLRYLLLLGTLAAFVVAIAQTDKDTSNHRIIVDGAKEPDRIPDWILWHQIFQMAASHNDKLPGKGRELWIDTLHLPQSAMNELVQNGYDHRNLQAAAKNEKDKVLADSRGESNKDRVRVKLHKTQAYFERQTLELRDKLRSRIGEDAFLRLQSY